MSFAARTALAITLTTLIVAVATATAVRGVLHSNLDVYRDHFEMMRSMMNGYGPDLVRLYALVDSALVKGFIIGVVLIIVAATWIGVTLSRSISDLDRALKRFAAGDLEASIPERGPTEIVRIARSANAMASQLDIARATERELVAGIAHDLAHPLTALRGTLEAVRDGMVDLADPTVAERLFASINALDATLGDLRDVAAFDAGQLRLERQPVDLSAIVSNVGRMYEDYARRRSVTIETKSESVIIETDRRRLERVIDNLTLNAIQATQPSGTVKLWTVCEPDAASVEIENEVGVEAARRVSAALFTGRNTGLGLRVVRTIGEALGARFSISTSLRGCIIRVEFERYEAASNIVRSDEPMKATIVS